MNGSPWPNSSRPSTQPSTRPPALPLALALSLSLAACAVSPPGETPESTPESTPENASERAAPGSTPADAPENLSDETPPDTPRVASRDVPRSPLVSEVVPDAPASRFSRPARLGSRALRELSGLAVSMRDAGVLWAINDSGAPAMLHAMTRTGTTLGTWPVEAVNRDWEDLAALRIDDVPHLLIADTGDNRRRHEEYALHLVAEPSTREPGTTLTPTRTIRFRYEDGAHDVEAVGVSGNIVNGDADTVWLLVKEPLRGTRAVPSGVYTVSLDAPDPSGTVLTARRVATLAAPRQGLEARLAAVLAGIDLEQPTAFEFAPDGRRACLLTYRRVRCFARLDGESWHETLARPGRVLGTHDLDQAEALALSPDGLVWFTSEGLHAPLRTLPLPR